MQKILFWLILLTINNAYSQSENKSEGYRIVYLDASFEVIDSADAFYVAYSYFDGGHDLNGVTYMTSGMSYAEISYYGVGGNLGDPKILDGRIVLTSENTKYIREFKEGYPVLFTESHIEETDTIYCELRYYDSLYYNQPGSYYFEFFGYDYYQFGFFRNGKYGWEQYPEFDSRGLAYGQGIYPYWKGLVPPFVGIVTGLEGFKNYGYELGIAMNLGYLEEGTYGGLVGAILSFKNRFDKSYYSICAELGIYAPISLGLGYSYNSNGFDHTNSFRLFTGITIFHLQMLYGYNFYSNSMNQIPELFHHSFTLRYVLPVLRF